MSVYVCCVDAGTSRIKAGLVDRRGKMIALAAAPAPQLSHGNGPLAFDPAAHYRVMCRLLRSVRRMAGVPAAQIAAISVANQRATIIALGADEGVLAALSWQDTRCSAAIDGFIRKFGAARFQRITGLPSSPLWSLGKILWLQQEHPAAYRSAAWFVLLHDYLMRRLGAPKFITDFSNASLTGLLDITQRDWSPALLRAVGIAAGQLPALQPAAARAGVLSAAAAAKCGLRAGTPLIVGGGDQQCAALGIGAVAPGDAGLCLGTAAVISCPVARPVHRRRGGFFCTAHVVPERWVVEGFHTTFGGALRWLLQLLRLRSVQEFEQAAMKASPAWQRITFLPFLAGIGSPDFDADARGVLAGLDLTHGRSEIARAAIEGVALETRRILEQVTPFVHLKRLVAVGGISARDIIPQAIADATGQPLFMCRTSEATLHGLACLAWTGVGAYRDIVAAARRCAGGTLRRLQPAGGDPRRAARYTQYCAWVNAARRTADRSSTVGGSA